MVKYNAPAPLSSTGSAAGNHPSRRRFLGSLAAAGSAALGFGFYVWRIEPHWLELTAPRLPIAGLPSALEGATLAHLSDLHVGPRVDDGYLISSLRKVRVLAPDFVVCTGDWLTYRGPSQLEQLQRVLAQLPRGRLGTLGILGNHDYGYHWRMEEVAERVVAIAGAAGVSVLRNAARTVAGLQFLGIDDLWSPRFDPEPVLANRNRELPTLALCHNPDAVDHPAWQNYQGWILAGHTHGGQCKPPFLPPPLLPVRNKRYRAGEILAAPGRRLYISRGIGHLLRVRCNVRPEIPIFRLERS